MQENSKTRQSDDRSRGATRLAPLIIGLLALLTAQAAAQTKVTRGGIGNLKRDAAHAGKVFCSDVAHIYTAPFRVTRKKLLWLGATATVGMIIYHNDQKIHDHFACLREKDWYDPIEEVGQSIEKVGHMGKTNRYYFGTLAIGYLFKIQPLITIPAQILEAHFTSGGVKNVSSYIVGRDRPYTGKGYHSFGDGSSFPSGHSINVFELAAILSHHCHYWPATIGWYALATSVAFQRITEDSHWASDVYAGALLGTVVAREILKLHEGRQVSLSPTLSGDGRGLGLSITMRF